MIANQSVDNSLEDEKAKKSVYDNGCVRANMILSGWLIKPITKTSCLIDFSIQLDPGGWIPVWAFHEPKIILKVRDYYHKIKK